MAAARCLLGGASAGANPLRTTRDLDRAASHHADDRRFQIDRRGNSCRHPDENARAPRPGEARPQAGIHSGTSARTLRVYEIDAGVTIDPYILTFSALTIIATVWMGFWAARNSKTASDFYVAGRSVSVGWNA